MNHEQFENDVNALLKRGGELMILFKQDNEGRLIPEFSDPCDLCNDNSDTSCGIQVVIQNEVTPIYHLCFKCMDKHDALLNK